MGNPPTPVAPLVLIITDVTNASADDDSRVVTQYPRLSMFIGSSVSLPRTKKIATIVASKPKARTTSGKKIQASGFGQPDASAIEIDRDAQDHRADVLGGSRLEQVGTAAGAVADVVANEVRHHAGITRVVLGDALLDLSDEVRTDVGGLRVDAAAELGEEGDERRSKAEPDDQERRLLHRHVRDERVVEREDAPHAEEREGDDEEPGDGPAAHRDLDCLHEAPLGRRRGPNVGPDGDEHADDAGGHRAQCADEEGDRGHDPDRKAGESRHVSDLRRLDERDEHADEDGAHDREDEDRRVLAPNEGDGTLEDRAGDVLHRLRPLVARQHVASEIDGEEDRHDTGDRDHPGDLLHETSERGRRPR